MDKVMVREPFVQVCYIVLYEEFGYSSEEIDCGGGEGFFVVVVFNINMSAMIVWRVSP